MSANRFPELADVHEFALEHGAAYIAEPGRPPVYLFNAERLASMIQRIMLSSVEHIYQRGHRDGVQAERTRGQ